MIDRIAHHEQAAKGQNGINIAQRDPQRSRKLLQMQGGINQIDSANDHDHQGKKKNKHFNHYRRFSFIGFGELLI